MRKKDELSRKVILDHYRNQGVRKAILSASKIGRSQRALITGSAGWYQYRESKGETEVALKPLDPIFYDRGIPKMVERGRRR